MTTGTQRYVTVNFAGADICIGNLPPLIRC